MVAQEFNRWEQVQPFVTRAARLLAEGDEHLASDLAQDAFVALLCDEPRDPGALHPWLWTIMRNRAISLRLRELRGPRFVEIDESQAHPEPDLDNAEERVELISRAVARVERMAPIYREAIRTRILEGRGMSESARRLGIPLETLRSRLRRGLSKLRRAAPGIEGRGSRGA